MDSKKIEELAKHSAGGLKGDERIEHIQGFIKGYETALDEKDKLTNSLLTYSENQRKIIVLLLDAIETVRGHLPFSTDLKLTEIINSSQKFTKPLPPPPIQQPSK